MNSDYDNIEYLDDSLEDEVEDYELPIQVDKPVNTDQKIVFVVLPKDKSKSVSKGTVRAMRLSTEEKDVFDEELLKYVFDRPPLFNYCLPIQQRSSGIINRLWGEVLEAMLPTYPNINLANLKESFKYHRDLYTRFKSHNAKVPSGSGTVPKLVPKHLEILRQLDNVIAKRKQITSVECMEQPLDATVNLEHMPPQKKQKQAASTKRPCSTQPRPGSSTSTRPGSSMSQTTSDPIDLGDQIDKLVGAVQLSAAQRNERNDRAQNFGDQVAWHMRGLNDVEFFEAASYINNYFYEKAKEKQQQHHLG